MSIHPTKHRTFEVRYRDAEGRNRSKSFPSRADAEKFEAALKEIKAQAKVTNAISAARKQVLG